MTARLETAAEILKLERLLGVEDGAFAFLADVEATEIRTLRERATDSLFDSGGQTLARVGASAKLLPSPLVASVCESTFGPLLCARAAATTDPAKAIDVAQRLSPEFLADTTVQLDPRRVARIISGVPTQLVEPVAAELGRRGEYVTMGRFLGFVSDDAIAAAMGSLSDEAMLRTAFVLEHKAALDHAVGLLPPDRMPGVLRCAAENDLWPEALDLIDNLSPERRAAIAVVVAGLGNDVVAGLIAAVARARIWESLLPIVDAMGEDDIAKIVEAVDHADRSLGEVLVDQLTEPDQVRALLDGAPPALIAAVERAADRLGLRAEFDAAVASAGP